MLQQDSNLKIIWLLVEKALEIVFCNVCYNAFG